MEGSLEGSHGDRVHAGDGVGGRGGLHHYQGLNWVEIAYGGGRDRTDTILATLACHEGLEPEAAIRWVREHYDAHAVETPWQRRWVRASRKGGEAR